MTKNGTLTPITLDDLDAQEVEHEVDQLRALYNYDDLLALAATNIVKHRVEMDEMEDAVQDAIEAGLNMAEALQGVASTSMTFATSAPDAGRSQQGPTMSELGVIARAEKDPRTKEWVFIRGCFDAWQKSPHRYESYSAFARDMLEKVEHLKSASVITRHCREWRKEVVTPPVE